MKKLQTIGVVTTCIIGFSCGAEFVGRTLQDAGAQLVDSGVAHAQANCTWRVRRFSLVNSGGTSWAQEIQIDAGWEPFATVETAVLARRCQ